MSEREPQYESMSLVELLDVAAHIDRQRFPDRWRRVQSAIAAHRPTTESAPSGRLAAAATRSPSLSYQPIPAGSPQRGMSRREGIIFVSFLSAVALAFATWSGIALFRSHFWRGPDVQFGDQHLKTAVALIELHRVRFGNYPARLSELQFVGDWDSIALSSVSYKTNTARTRYCVEVERGWVAKPNLTMPPEFWRGTGYDTSLCREVASIGHAPPK